MKKFFKLLVVGWLAIGPALLLMTPGLSWAGAAGATGGNPAVLPGNSFTLAPVRPALRLGAQKRGAILLAGRRQDASRRNKAACETWCNANKPEYHFCSTRRGCTAGYSRLQSWTGYGTNYHACGRRVSRRQASERNRQACDQWCRANPGCAKCEDAMPGCRAGFERLRSFRGRGWNYVACGRRDYRNPSSNRNRTQCEAWCRAHSDVCSFCKPQRGCLGGYYRLRSWTGRGRNWHACGSRYKAGQRNQNDCNVWCRATPGCIRCSTLRNCGRGQSRLRSWTGKGRNWHACGKRRRGGGRLEVND